MMAKVAHTLSEVDEQVLGTPKLGATHFTVVQEVKPKRWLAARTWVDRPGILQTYFPIRLLSVDFFRERWGPGVYKTTWFEHTREGKAVPLGPGRRFEVAKLEAPPVSAPAPTGVERRDRHLRVKVKRGSLKSQLSVLSQLQTMQRESVNMAVAERVAFIQAEAQRNREHQLELERLRMRHDRDRRDAAPAAATAAAPSSSANGSAPDMTAAVAAGISQIVEKLDAVVEGGGDKSDLMRMGEMLAPGFNKIVGVIERVVLDKLNLEDDDDGDELPDDTEPDQPDA